MSQSTYIHYYTTARPQRPQDVIRETLSLLKADHIKASRYTGPDTSWADLRNEDSEGPAYEILAKRVTIEEAAATYIAGKFLTLDVSSPITKTLSVLVDQSIPEAIRADHWPHNLSFYIDSHDVFENAENTRGELFDRAFVSVKWWGYSTPHNITEYRKRVLSLPLIAEIQANLSRVLGTVDCQVYMQL